MASPGRTVRMTLAPILLLSTVGCGEPGGVSGVWRSLEDNGEASVTLTLEQDGTSLSGTLTSHLGHEFPLTWGEVEGDQVRFAFYEAYGFTNFHRLTWAGDRMEGSYWHEKPGSVRMGDSRVTYVRQE